MAKNFAYETYKKVEASSNFVSAKDRERYIQTLAKRTERVELPFLKKHLKQGGRVLEVGSGSGRILHALLQKKMITQAVGVEISPSRVAFGKWWAKKAGLSEVRHIAADILRGHVQGPFDTVLCLTSIFPFFDMLEQNGFRTFLRKARLLLVPGGALILETETFNKEIKLCNDAGGSCTEWQEYPAHDPFRFHLLQFQWEKKSRELTARSYNIMRDRFFIDGPTVKKWHFETAAALKKLLLQEGYKDIRFFGDYDSSPYQEGVSPRLIITAHL